MNVDIGILTHKELTENRLTELTSLLRILNPNVPSLTCDRVHVITNEGHVLLVAENTDGMIVGTATLIYYHQLMHGRVALIETVVVNEQYQRHGIGRALIVRLLQVAKQGGVKKVRLTSNPTRTRAHQLYQSIGFLQSDTYVFDYTYPTN